MRELRGRRLAPATIFGQALSLRKFLQFCADQGVFSLENLEFRHLRDFARDLERQGLTPTTRYGLMGAVRRWLKWAHYRDYLLHNPATNWEPRHPPPTYRWVPTEAQMEQALAAPDQDTLIGQRDGFLLEFLYGTGLRVQECANLNLQDLDLHQHRFTVRQGKGGKSRVLPLGDRTYEKLTTYLQQVRPQLSPGEGEKALFLNRLGGRLAAFSISAEVRRYGLQCGFPALSVHSIRHAYATHLLLGGAPLALVQRLLGHDSIGSTTIYTRLLPLDLQAEILRTHPRGKIRPKKPPKDRPT